MRIDFAKLRSGDLYEHWKGIMLVGRLNSQAQFIVYGCEDRNQEKFYKGLLEYDKISKIQRFKTIQEVAEWWNNVSNDFVIIEPTDFILTDEYGIEQN